MARGEIYIELAVNHSEDPKVRALFRYGRDARACRDLFVQMICYAKRNLTDGFVPDEELPILVYPDPPKHGKRDADRLVDAQLLQRVEGGYVIPAYIKRNKSKAQVMQAVEDKQSGGSLGNHRRWHVREGIFKDGCRFCRAAAAEGTADWVTDGSRPPKNASRKGNDAKAESTPGASTPREEADVASPDPHGETDKSHTENASPQFNGFDADRSTDRPTDRGANRSASRERSPETETETETPPPTPRRDRPEPPGNGTAHEEEGEDDHPHDHRDCVTALVAEVRAIRPEWSSKSIARALTAPAVAERPWPAIRTAILAVANDPNTQAPGRVKHDGPWWHQPRRTHASSSANSRPVTEVIGGTLPPLGERENPANARGAAIARAAITKPPTEPTP
ncbi:hypothetical protein [Sphaerisporangium aureirubrum]|uniref:Uncharacterized protein n=1 Tax=Sphaerisporangium aureirubrum TaxID=1544736 RepID=A0ABW1NG30_9ACTN